VPRDSDRSLARIDIADLLRLAALAADAEAELFGRKPQGSGRYAGRALCQGAALHYVRESNGVKDSDVWSFYARYDDWPFPARWRATRDFGPSKFGRYPGDPPRYSGRRVDLLGRSADVTDGGRSAGRGRLPVQLDQGCHTAAAKLRPGAVAHYSDGVELVDQSCHRHTKVPHQRDHRARVAGSRCEPG
jgi:hypothetical protein